MHELSIALSIINLAIKEAEKSNATRVSELELEIGEMAGVNIVRHVSLLCLCLIRVLVAILMR